MSPAENEFVLRVPDDVAAALRKLHPIIKLQIRVGLGNILADPYVGKPLKDELQGLRSYRVKRYRIVYRIDRKESQIAIVAIGPRKIIYEETFRIIAGNL
jgi:mRNA interferase RelE/StbE